MNYIQISISPIDREQSELLMARLMDSDLQGFEEEENNLNAFFEEDKFNEENISDILSTFDLSFSKKIIAEKNWNEVWEKNFEPVIIEDFCTIRAGFHKSFPKSEYEIIITPKMSFGTGHHATTGMMIRAMKEIDFNEKKVFDFGTGTGILSILAEKMGAKSVLAIDNDEWSIKNASENISINHCSTITVEKRDSTPSEGIFDIILANINKLVIIQNLPSIQQHLADEGVLILSGFLKQDEKDFLRETADNNLSITASLAQDNWICLRLKKILS